MLGAYISMHQLISIMYLSVPQRIICYSFTKDAKFHLIIIINLLVSVDDKNNVTPNAGVKNMT